MTRDWEAEAASLLQGDWEWDYSRYSEAGAVVRQGVACLVYEHSRSGGSGWSANFFVAGATPADIGAAFRVQQIPSMAAQTGHASRLGSYLEVITPEQSALLGLAESVAEGAGGLTELVAAYDATFKGDSPSSSVIAWGTPEDLVSGFFSDAISLGGYKSNRQLWDTPYRHDRWVFSGEEVPFDEAAARILALPDDEFAGAFYRIFTPESNG